MKTKLLLAVMLISLGLEAQDFHLSQFDAFPMAMNPGATGMYKGSRKLYRAHIHYRDQWRSISHLSSNPFTVAAAAYDQRKKRFGLGGYVINNQAGSGSYNTMTAAFSIAYEITDDPREIQHLSAGVQLGYNNKSFIPSSLTWGNQYSRQYNGGDFDPGISSQEYFSQLSVHSVDLNIGVYYYRSDKNSMFNPYVGLAGYHLLFWEEEFTISAAANTNEKNIIHPKVVLTGGTNIKLNRTWSLDPSLLYMQRTNNTEVAFGTLINYHMIGTDGTVFAGPYYRWNDAFYITLGCKYRDFIFRASYDVNTSSMSAGTQSVGGFEVSITYLHQKSGRVPSIF